jgi:hypothetical protein
VALAFVPLASAQQHENDPAKDDQNEMESFRALMEQEARELSVKNPENSEIISLVERIMMVRLAKTLGLSIEETQMLGHRVGNCRQRVYNLKWLRAEKRDQLRRAIESGDEKEIERQLSSLLKLEVTIAEMVQQMIEESKSELTVEQSAKFYLFIDEFEYDISATIAKAREISRQRDAEAAKNEPKDDHK